MDVLVINLMRLGDLIQTGPVLRRLRAAHPHARVSLLVMDLFQETARLLPEVDRLLIFPSSSLATLLMEENGWVKAVVRLEEWLAGNFPEPPRVVVNLTPNRLGALLARVTGAHEIRGMLVDARRRFATRPAWASYALIVSRARQANPFNLVDLFLREAGLWPDGEGLAVELPPASRQEARHFLASLGLPPQTALVGLLPGASHPARCWPPAHFAEAALQLLKARPCHFFLFGSAGERERGEDIARQLPEGAATLLLGRTCLALLAAHLERLDLLITNDTGPMHLAAAVGTPTLALFLASARVQDTGPVGKGHVILEPRLDCHPCLAPCPQPRCHQAVTPAAVAWWARRLLEAAPLAPLRDNDLLASLRVFLGAADPQGYQTCLPLVRRPLDRRHFWLWLHRAVWGEALDGGQPNWPTLEDWLAAILTRHYLPPEDDLGSPEGGEALAELCRLARRGEELAAAIGRLAAGGQPPPGRLWAKIEALEGVDQGLRQLAVAFPEAAAFVEFFLQEQRLEDGAGLTPLAGELGAAYARLARLGELARKRLTSWGAALDLAQCGREVSPMAHIVQNGSPKNDAIQAEREGAPCR